MNFRKVRIGDFLDDRAKDLRRSVFKYDNLSIRVFLPDLDPRNVEKFFIMSPCINEIDSDKLDKEIFKGLGDHERNVLSKILDPPIRISFLVGEMGSGKSTTLSYLIKKLRASYKDENDESLSIPLIINLNDSKFETQDEDEAEFLLYNDLCTELRSTLKINNFITDETEYVDFLNQKLQEISHYFGSSPFKELAAKLNQNNIFLEKNDKKFYEKIDERKELIKELEKNKENYFNYLLHLWKFVFDQIGEDDCSLILFENVDKASIVVQYVMLKILNQNKDHYGPKMFAVMRPETFNSHCLNSRNSGFVDPISQEWLEPFDAIRNRLDKFLESPYCYFEENDGLTQVEFNEIFGFLQIVNNTIANDQKNIYRNFVNKACGWNIRLAMMCGINLFKISEIEFNKGDLSPHTLNRITVVNQCNEQFKTSIRVPIPNLFLFNDHQSSSYLLKPRVLQYLFGLPGNESLLSEISRYVSPFGYSIKQLRIGLEELLNPYCQLVRTNGFEKYDTDSVSLYCNNDILALTKMGEGYASKILYDLDYLQEIMLDCYLPSNWVNQQFSFTNIPEKLSLLIKFLGFMFELDKLETELYVSKMTIEGYHKFFGEEMLTLRIMNSVCNSIYRICGSVVNKNLSGEKKKGYFDVLDKSEDRLNYLNYKNLEILGINSAKSKDLSNKICVLKSDFIN